MKKISFNSADIELVSDISGATIENRGIAGLFPAEASIPASQIGLLEAAGVEFSTIDNNF